MKYYLSTLAVDDHDSKRDYYSRMLIVANDEKQAHQLAEKIAAGFGGLPGRKVGRAYRFGEADGDGYTVYTDKLKEISPATFSELSDSFHVVGNAERGDLATQEPAEQAKTLARRLGDQLAKRGAKVPHSLLLHAVAAGLGKTDWQVLAGQAKEDTSGPWYPEGNWPTGPLRDIAELQFIDRVNAIWLTHGDVKLAAKLLHVDPEALMNSFKTAGEADLAFCGRTHEWKPEHSLAPSFAAALEGYRFRIETTELDQGRYQVKGFVGTRQIVQLDNRLDPHTWYLGHASTPSQRETDARLELACYDAAMRRAAELSNRANYPDDESTCSIQLEGDIKY